MRWSYVVIYVCAMLLGIVAVAAYTEMTEDVAPQKPARLLPPRTLALGPFRGVDPAQIGKEEFARLVQIARDFALVQAGKPPACKYTSMSAFSDGGTAIYECPGYTLTVMKALYSFQGSHGYLYGPIVSLGGDNSVSDVRFYSSGELAKLQGVPGGL